MWAPKLGLKGIQRIHLLPDAIVLAGAGVGGGSLVYSNVLYEPKSEAFYTDKQWAHITDWRHELAPYYDQAKRMLGRAESPTLTVVDELARKVAAEMGVERSFELTPVGVFFGREGRKEPGAGRRRSVLRRYGPTAQRLHRMRGMHDRLSPRRQEHPGEELSVSGGIGRRGHPSGTHRDCGAAAARRWLPGRSPAGPVPGAGESTIEPSPPTTSSSPQAHGVLNNCCTG